MNITQKIELENFHYEDISKNYKKGIYLGQTDGGKGIELLTDIGQLMAYEQGARFIQSLDIPKKDRKITLSAEIPESYHTYKLSQHEISPHIIKLESHGYVNTKKLAPFYFDIECGTNFDWILEEYSYFSFEIQADNMNKTHFVYQKPIFRFGRGSILDACKLGLLNTISGSIKHSEAKAEFRQEIFYRYGSVMQLVLEGEFNILKNNTQKNKSMKTIELLENKIYELIKD